MARFDRAIQTALRLIAKNGEVVTWKQVSEGGAADPDEPWNQLPAETKSYNATVCFLPVDRITMETFNFAKGTEVPKGSVMALMGKVPFEPGLQDTIERGDQKYRIASLDVLSPNGQKVLYTAVLQE